MAGATVTYEFVIRVLDTFSLTCLDCTDLLWWRTDGNYAPVSFFVDCSDVFFWGSTDCEPLTTDNIDELDKAIADVKAINPSECYYAVELFCSRRRKMRPQGAAYPKNRDLWPLFDACGPARDVGLGNPYRSGKND